MPEAEEVLTDVARHATVWARDLWRRRRADAPADGRTALRDVAARLDLLVTAVFGCSLPIRAAEPPAPRTFLDKVFLRGDGPRAVDAVPATDGTQLWLPPEIGPDAALDGATRMRVLALQQAARAARGSAARRMALDDALAREVFAVLEAQAADATLVRALPGLRAAIDAMRRGALAARPPLDAFPPHRRALEGLVRATLASDPAHAAPLDPACAPDEARRIADAMRGASTERRVTPRRHVHAPTLLLRDLWTGELRAPPADASARVATADAPDPRDDAPPRSARLARRPQARAPSPGEDDARPGAWMVQTSQPHEQVEDPVGMQRPTDRDAQTAAEDWADALSELPEARLVSTPGRPKEVLLSDDPPAARAKRPDAQAPEIGAALRYPEWDWRVQAYRANGVTVRVRLADEGPQAWVDRTHDAYRAIANQVRRRFEMLRAQRMRLRRQLDGDDVDVDAWVDGHADFRAGRPLPEALYQCHRDARRDVAVLVLADVSGSTDSWVSANRRVIDVEREALYLVSIALQGLGAPYAVIAFSGEGPHGVDVRRVKAFDEAFDAAVARRIASLEPEHYTRAGAAIRHATALLMREPAGHRLLLLLSDGKPNDADRYEGRYGVEDMRQAVTEAKLQGVHPFCLTVDRQAAGYLPGIFGAHQYALLPRPERLPTVLLEWMRRLVRA